MQQSARATISAALFLSAALACGGKEAPAPPPQTQSASAPAAPIQVLRIEIGDPEEALTAIPDALRVGLSLDGLTHTLVRDFGDASQAIDLGAPMSASLYLVPGEVGFYTITFGLRDPASFRSKFSNPGPKVDPKGHDLSLLPLPGSPLSPFDKPLYLDINGKQLILSDSLRGEAQVLATPLQQQGAGVHAEANLALLWELFGAKLEGDYLAEKRRRAVEMHGSKAAKPPERVPWEQLFTLGKGLSQAELDITLAPVHGTLTLETKTKLPKANTLQGLTSQILSGSQFGYHLQIPSGAVQILGAVRERFAPLSMDALGFFYPLARLLEEDAWVSGGVDEKGLWITASYRVEDEKTARALLISHFARKPDPKLPPMEEGRTFTVTEGAEKLPTGEPVDLVVAALEKPSDPILTALGLDRIEIRVASDQGRVYLAAGPGGAARLAALRQELGVPGANGAATPSKEPTELPKALAEKLPKAPIAVAWFSRAGFLAGNLSAIDTALTFSQEDGALRFDLVLAPEPTSAAASPAPSSAPAPR